MKCYVCQEIKPANYLETEVLLTFAPGLSREITTSILACEDCKNIILKERNYETRTKI